MLFFLLEDLLGVGDCCVILDFSNSGLFDVYGINFSVLDGVEFQFGYSIVGGLYMLNYMDIFMLIVFIVLGLMFNNIN